MNHGAPPLGTPAATGSRPADAGGTGLLTIAFGHRRYARMAVDLARSIRLRDPTTPLAVATDLDATFFRGCFEHVVPWQARYASYFERKFDLGAMSPFDRTLFLDADCLVLRPLADVFAAFDDHDFSVAGRNPPRPWWFSAPEAVRAEVDRPSYPGFNGGLLHFRRTPRSDAVFARARSLLPRYDDLGLARLPEGGINDEPLFSIAMAELGCRAAENDRLEIFFGPRLGALAIDVLGGTCEIPRDGRVLRPMVCHFEGSDKDRPAYARERLRLAANATLGRVPRVLEAPVAAAGLGRWALERVAARGARALRRLRTDDRA